MQSKLIAKEILEEIVSMLYTKKSSKSSKNMFKYATIFNSATSGIRRSFGIHNLHRRFTKHRKTSTQETTVELTVSNPDFNTVVVIHEKESTENISEIELSEVEVLPLHT